MPHIKFQGHRPIDSGESFNGLLLSVVHVTWTVGEFLVPQPQEALHILWLKLAPEKMFEIVILCFKGQTMNLTSCTHKSSCTHEYN